MEIRLKNFMEDVVAQHLDPVMRASGCCMCNICRMDVTAIALNNLKPCYVATQKGEVYAKLGELTLQFAADVISAIAKGAEMVCARPRHDEDR